MRAASTFTRRGRPRLQRLRLHPDFIETLREQRMPMSHIALACGCRHSQQFSNLMHDTAIPVTKRALFERVAKVIGYTKPIFIEVSK